MKRFKKRFGHHLFIIVSLFLASCSAFKKNTSEIGPNEGKQIVSVRIKEERFVTKNLQATQMTEFYARYSGRDYFIKFCESQISREDLEGYLTRVNKKVLNLEMEIRRGRWDICDQNYSRQSRTGDYMIVYGIMTDEM
ncbi:MAG: hypothetical protein AAGA66_15585 [Bacteroidota bacterium]